MQITIAYSEAAKCQPYEKEDETCTFKNCKQDRQCDVEFEVEENMDGDVYVYYELENFYQSPPLPISALHHEFAV